MTALRPLLALMMLVLTLAGPAAVAEDLSALAKVNPLRSGIVARGDGGLELKVALSQPVPWRLRLMDNPPRLVIDAREIDWRGVEALAVVRPGVSLRAGAFRPGWSRLVLELAGPLKVARAEMVTGDEPRIELVLAPTDAASFALDAARPDLPDWALPEAAAVVPPLPEGGGPLVVVLDPGHGGIDPGAEREDHSEAALMLTFARELKEALVRDGRFRVVLTREEDVFVPLETRTSLARGAGADGFRFLPVCIFIAAGVKRHPVWSVPRA